MLNSIKITVFLLLTSIFAVQAEQDKVFERIKTLKKIKLIDYLNLSEEKSEKFLLKYNSFENKIEEKNKEIEKEVEELEKLTNDNSSNLKSRIEKMEKLQNDIFSLINERNQAIKAILSEKEYAKFLVFEKKFAQELRKNLFKMRNKNKKID